MFDEEEKKYLQKLAYASLPKIKDSELFVTICPPNFMDSPECIFQLGAAMLMDKPIGLLVLKGRTVPRQLEKIAKTIVYCEKEQPQQHEMQELMARLGGA